MGWKLKELKIYFKFMVWIYTKSKKPSRLKDGFFEFERSYT
jgi:hypothetical protein